MPPRNDKRDIPMLSEAEERALQSQIAGDPDAAELTDAQLKALRPARDVLPEPLYVALLGRPATVEQAMPVTINVDRDVVEAFKATGEDWKARMTATLAREAKRLTKAS